jgi:ornithine--oxo-acid transaminase
VCGQNFHGRTTTIISFSSDPDAKGHYGPYTPGFVSVPYNDLPALRAALDDEPEKIAAFLVEPIQGEAGVFVPDDDFIPQAAALCRDREILLHCGRNSDGYRSYRSTCLRVCGDCSCGGHCERQATYTRPDILILGKAISGGVYPVSAVLADDAVMEVIRPGQHGSTFGGNPLACAVAQAALEVIRDEKLTQNARKLGQHFRERMQLLVNTYPQLLLQVRGKGLLNAVVINDTTTSKTAWNLCVKLAENGLLAKPTHGNIIRFAPPLIMTEKELAHCCDIIEQTVADFAKTWQP